MAHIVLLGAGIGGLPAAYELRELLGNAHSITVVNASEQFQFVPSNPWVAVGWRTRRDITIDLKPCLTRKGIEFIAQTVTRIEPGVNRLHLADGRTVDYDYLVIATGPKLAFDEVPGSGPSGHTHSICTLDHAESAFTAFEQFMSEPGPAIVGAMQGASCFGPAYEFAFILNTALKRHRRRSKVPMTFVTSEPYVGHMGLGGVGDSRGLMTHEFREHHINFIPNCKVLRVEKGVMVAAEHNLQGEQIKEHQLPFKYSMMLPAFKGVDAVAGVEGLCNPRGFVLVDKNQRSPKYPNIFAVGVCIAIPPVEVTPVPTGAPKTGYMIETMVRAVAENIRDELSGKKAVAEPTWNAICLADMGDTGAAFVALPQMPPRNITWSKKGKWVHLAKIAFEKYFLYKMRRCVSEPVFERYFLKVLRIDRLEAEKKV